MSLVRPGGHKCRRDDARYTFVRSVELILMFAGVPMVNQVKTLFALQFMTDCCDKQKQLEWPWR